jgi:hypothetical protein
MFGNLDMASRASFNKPDVVLSDLSSVVDKKPFGILQVAQFNPSCHEVDGLPLIRSLVAKGVGLAGALQLEATATSREL